MSTWQCIDGDLPSQRATHYRSVVNFWERDVPDVHFFDGTMTVALRTTKRFAVCWEESKQGTT